MGRLKEFIFGSKPKRLNVDGAFIGGINRDFNKELNERDEKQAVAECKQFVKGVAFEHVLNNQLKLYTETLLTEGESMRERKNAATCISLILKIEGKFKELANRMKEAPEEFDEFSIT